MAKDPRYVESGKRGARTRWDREAAARGAPVGPRTVRLDALPREVAAVVRALVDAAEAARDPDAGQS